MKYEDRFDSLMEYLAGEIFPDIDWLIVKAQCWQESRMKTDALSPAGCKGLMQISEPLAKERLAHPEFVWYPDVNLRLGVEYLKEQYDHFPEIPLHHNKLLFALASYNCGRGYVNMALRLARHDEKRTIRQPGHWQSWTHSGPYLRDPRCVWRAKRPDWRQVLEYVEKIMWKYSELKASSEFRVPGSGCSEL